MKIILFTHPPFVGSNSMPRYANLILQSMLRNGHEVKIRTAKSYFSKLAFSPSSRKWFGYVDQYFIFPMVVRFTVMYDHPLVLYVFADHALGPWVPLVSNRFHVVHCHDFLAQKSAIGMIKENPVGLTGRLYQRFIRWGYSKAKNFISISDNTKRDLEKLVLSQPQISEVVYNGMNQLFTNLDVKEARHKIQSLTETDLRYGYILHVGGNMWYKNRLGVVEIYNAWRKASNSNIPLLLVGPSPDRELIDKIAESEFRKDICVLCDLANDYLNQVYSGATVLLFPSLGEGFGWPIAEAMASGCPVITTNEAPMNEVGGNVAFYIERMNVEKKDIQHWAIECALVLDNVVKLPEQMRKSVTNEGILRSKMFDDQLFGERIEVIYKRIVDNK